MSYYAAPVVAETDLHCHLLPAWDDGPSTLEESLRMAARAAGTGIKNIVVTPHVGKFLGSIAERPARDIPAATARLQEELDTRGIAVNLVPGAEVTWHSPELIEEVVVNPALTIGGQGRYVLMESPFPDWTPPMNYMVQELAQRGITSIIAHPERLANVERDPGVLETAVRQGALLQITARSLLRDERRSRRCCRQLLQAGLVAIVASDAHSSQYVLPGEVAAQLCALVGEVAAHRILVDNPRRVLDAATSATKSPLPVAASIRESHLEQLVR